MHLWTYLKQQNLAPATQQRLHRQLSLCGKILALVWNTVWLKEKGQRHVINPRRAGPLDFPPHAGEVQTSPRLSRLLGIVEKNEKLHWKGSQKTLRRKYFGEIFAQVKFEVKKFTRKGFHR